MSHMVIFRSSDGKTGYHQAEVLEEAVHYVERIRNAEGVEQARIFRLEEVRFEFRPYFHVQVAETAPTDPPVATAAVPVAEAVTPAPEPADDGRAQTLTEALPDELEMTPVPEGDALGGANGRRGLFGR